MTICSLIAPACRIEVSDRVFTMKEMSASELCRLIDLLIETNFDDFSYIDDVGNLLLSDFKTVHDILNMILPSVSYDFCCENISMPVLMNLLKLQMELNGVDRILNRGPHNDNPGTTDDDFNWFDICSEIGSVFSMSPMDVWDRFSFRQIGESLRFIMEKQSGRRAGYSASLEENVNNAPRRNYSYEKEGCNYYDTGKMTPEEYYAFAEMMNKSHNTGRWECGADG